MITKLIAYCSKNKLFTFLFTAIAIVWSVYAVSRLPLDAIPDLSDVQVIVLTEWPGSSPDLVEDQITYPIVSAMVAAPRVQVARGFSFFGLSFVYIIFEDGTDIYWARSRVLEYMDKITGNLPRGVNPTLGPDATGVGWIFEYALIDESGQNSLSDLRTFQDWYLRYWLESVPGVAEVASVGGFVKQYQIEIDPNRLLAYNIPLKKVIQTVQASNNDVGGRILEMAETEYMIRGRGYIRNLADVEAIAVGSDVQGRPIRIADIANVRYGPDMRRGAAEFNGLGEAVGGIVVMRFGENALQVINRVKAKIEEVRGSLPPGVELITTYDRSSLIKRSIQTLRNKLFQELVIVALMIIFFLWHIRSALVPIITLPVAAVLSFIPMYYMGVTSNVMSLGGIAIAMGAMVDASIVLVDNVHRRLTEWQQGEQKEATPAVILRACQEVGRPLFFSLLVIAVSFTPIFALTGQEGRLFKPLAFTKNFAMFFAALLAVTLAPALLQVAFRKGKISRLRTEEEHPLNPRLQRWYSPAIDFVLKKRTGVIIATLLAVLAIFPIYSRLGSEFMPPLNEGDILYMPTTLPGISIGEATQWLQIQDKLLKSFPEVETVFGKIGRARTATDPAPLSMVETVVQLKPMKKWPEVYHERWYSSWAPSWLRFFMQPYWPEWRRRSWNELIQAMDQRLQLPGTTNAWIMPIKTRIDMLTTGIRTPIGIKIFGSDLNTIEEIGKKIEGMMPQIEGTRSVFSERVSGGYYINFDIKREAIARYGLTVADAEEIVETAIGGKNITMTVEGRERFPVNIRYPRELRSDLDQLRRVLVPTAMGAHIPIAEIADLSISMGPPAIKDENGMLTGWVFVDLMEDRDIGSYVRDAKKLLRENLTLPTGYYLEWSGQFEYMERAKQRLMLVVPITLLIIIVLIYINTGNWIKTGIVLLAVPFGFVGAFLLLWLLNYNMSVAVWVGVIALAGDAAETGVIMLMYLDLAYEERVRTGRMNNWSDLKEAIHEGSSKRVRPMTMFVGTTFMALMPIMFAAAYESGADVMKRIAAPLVGGVFTSFLGVMLVFPVIYAVWRGRTLKQSSQGHSSQT